MAKVNRLTIPGIGVCAVTGTLTLLVEVSGGTTIRKQLGMSFQVGARHNV